MIRNPQIWFAPPDPKNNTPASTSVQTGLPVMEHANSSAYHGGHPALAEVSVSATSTETAKPQVLAVAPGCRHRARSHRKGGSPAMVMSAGGARESTGLKKPDMESTTRSGRSVVIPSLGARPGSVRWPRPSYMRVAGPQKNTVSASPWRAAVAAARRRRIRGRSQAGVRPAARSPNH